MSLLTNKQAAGLAVIVVVGVYFVQKKASDGADKLFTEWLNPTSDKNVIYNGIIGGTGRALSGDDSWSLGTWLYDITHEQDGIL